MIRKWNGRIGSWKRRGNFLFQNSDVSELEHHFGTWQSGITGAHFDVPKGVPINQEYVIRAMARVSGAGSWDVVQGPDSLAMK